VPLLSAVVTAVTPVGPQLYAAVIGVGHRSQYFSEWDSPDYSTLSCRVLGVLLFLTAGLMLRRGVRTWTDLAILLVAAVCAVWSWRTVPVAATMLVPLAAVQSRGGRSRVQPTRPPEAPGAAGAVVTLAALAVVVPQTADRPPAQPAWVDPALSSLPAGTKVVDSWDYAAT
jgi:hypothetical protein